MARAYFYVSLRYRQDFVCCSKAGVDAARLRPWMLRELLAWHASDPVSADERAFCDAVERAQGNRNPFIDFPDLADLFAKDLADPAGEVPWAVVAIALLLLLLLLLLLAAFCLTRCNDARWRRWRSRGAAVVAFGAELAAVELPDWQEQRGERGVCFQFRDTGRCRFGDRCKFSHSR